MYSVLKLSTSFYQGGWCINVIDYVGYTAGFLVTFALLPQIIRVYKLKSAREISILFNTSTLLGVVLWLTYGIVLGLIPIIVWNIIGIILTSLLLIFKMKWTSSPVMRKAFLSEGVLITIISGWILPYRPRPYLPSQPLTVNFTNGITVMEPMVVGVTRVTSFFSICLPVLPTRP